MNGWWHRLAKYMSVVVAVLLGMQPAAFSASISVDAMTGRAGDAPSTNHAPRVTAKEQTVEVAAVPATVDLGKSVRAEDDGLPKPPAKLTAEWKKLSGPGAVTFADASAINTKATFAVAGDYLLSVVVSDSLLKTTAMVHIRIKIAGGAHGDPGRPPKDDNKNDDKNDESKSGQKVAKGDDKTSDHDDKDVREGDDKEDNKDENKNDDVKNGQDDAKNGGEANKSSHTTKSEEPPHNQPPSTTNHRPQVDAGETQRLSGDTLPVSTMLHGKVTDDGLPNPPGKVTVKWSKLLGPADVTFESADALDTKATFSKIGRYILLLTANDGQLLGTERVEIIVGSGHPNEPPAGNRPPKVRTQESQNVQVDKFPATVDISGIVEDDGKPNPPGKVTTEWSKVSGPGTVTFGDIHALKTTATVSEAGNYALLLVASDGELQGREQLHLHIHLKGTGGGDDHGGEGNDDHNKPPTGDNKAPQLEIIDAPHRLVAPTLPASIVIKALLKDDGKPAPGKVTTKWLQLSGPGTATFGDIVEKDGKLETNITFPAYGTYVLVLTANDGDAQEAEEIKIRIEPSEQTSRNRPPEVDAGKNRTVNVDKLPAVVILEPKISDDGLPSGKLTWEWMKLTGPGTVTFKDVSTAASKRTEATFSAAGEYVLVVTADDGQFQRYDHVQIRIEVNGSAQSGNRAPEVNAGKDQTLPGAPLPVKATLKGVVTDDGLPNNKLTIEWVKIEGSAGATIDTPASAETGVSFTAVGNYVFALTADDGQYKRSDLVVIHVGTRK